MRDGAEDVNRPARWEPCWSPHTSALVPHAHVARPVRVGVSEPLSEDRNGVTDSRSADVHNARAAGGRVASTEAAPRGGCQTEYGARTRHSADHWGFHGGAHPFSRP